MKLVKLAWLEWYSNNIFYKYFKISIKKINKKYIPAKIVFLRSKIAGIINKKFAFLLVISKHQKL
ncbi:MAG TPA: hypothetical protein VFP07_01535 [Buchnera sp. (in: enterobacteria)]|nr:hypothetical protein [Buchnera sp. (in: enterobacteria)]